MFVTTYNLKQWKKLWEKIVSLQGLIGWCKLPRSGESCTKLVGQFLNIELNIKWIMVRIYLGWPDVIGEDLEVWSFSRS